MTESVLVVAAHPDDEALGCGGTVARLAKEGDSVHILFLADGESSRIGEPAHVNSERLATRNSSALQAGEILGVKSVDQINFPDNRMDQLALLDVIKPIEEIIDKYRPKTIFTHHSGDVNIDHRIVHDAVIAACRPQPGHPVRELLFYEVPSSTEWRPPGSASAFSPNWFVDITHVMGVKLKALQAYQDELREYPHPRSLDAIEALARWRGATIGVPRAEAFILGRKIS